MATDYLYEPERYELREEPRYHFHFDRRDFFRLMGLGMVVVGVVSGQESGGGGRRGGGARQRPQEIGPWLHIGEDGKVTAFTGKAEVGQNTRTALTQGVAEELRVPADWVRFVMADTARTPYDAGTFGSRSMPDMLPQVRKAAAAARELLIGRAASFLSVDRAQLKVVDGKVLDAASGKSVAYGELVKGQKLFETASIGSAPLTPPAEWKVLGTVVPKVDGRAFVTGKHQYTTDIKLPGMLYGAVVRPPSFGATLASVGSTSEPGVTVVREKDFLGIAAPDRATAQRVAAGVKAQWTTTPQPSDTELFAILKNTAKARTESTKGSIEEGLAAADKKLSTTYTLAYIAHAPLEPRAAVAKWDDGKLTAWVGTQRPFGVQAELANAFGIPESQVHVVVPDTGSGYGGKHTGEVAIEAARLAKQAGKPVKVVWTREEEFSWAYARPAGVIEVTSGVKDGKLVAWDFHNYNSGGSGLGPLYDVPHQRVHFHPSESPLRQGSYRGLAATANHFAREVHMDEIAHEIRKDPLEFRLANLKDDRLKAVFQRAADAFGWGSRSAGAGRGFGFGGGFEKGGYVATFAEVTADKDLKRVKVERVLTAFECGAVVNPDCLRNQIEGGVIQGLGGALFEQMQFADGKLLNGRFSRYRVPRFMDMPVIETVLVDRKDLPSAGAGETPIVGVAPAISNAIFAAVGVRLRAMPLLGSPQRA
ncbi:MAG TPA: molybdopterin cofactor-binding domain-containing protein [Bryobacteraceae bacterium]|nr:molybdopterin cofactor-binding domain-containing protein [Bryobacteraceae bacterium]